MVFLHAAFSEHLPALQCAPSVSAIELMSYSGSAAEQFMACARQAFARVQAILKAKPQNRVLLQVVIPYGKPISILLQALSGLIRSAQLENSQLTGQVICVEESLDTESLVANLNNDAEAAVHDQQEIRYVGGIREVAQLQPLEISPEGTNAVRWRNEGVYLITGGAGGLGHLLVAEIVRHSPSAKIVLAGRSALNRNQQDWIETVARANPSIKISYRVINVVDATEVVEAVTEIVEQYGALHGILHCAGVLNDGFLINKTERDFISTLQPKVLGAANVDAATSGSARCDFFSVFRHSLEYLVIGGKATMQLRARSSIGSLNGGAHSCG